MEDDVQESEREDDVMGGIMGGAGRREGDNKQKREGGITLATRPQSFYRWLICLIDGSGTFPA